jgi:hypothetical protein
VGRSASVGTPARHGQRRHLVPLAAVLCLAGSATLTPALVLAATEGDNRTNEPTFVRPAEDQLAAARALRVVDIPRPAPAEPMDESTFIDDSMSVVASIPESEWDLDALAASFGGDPRAAFHLVRDTIRYEPYPGVLRGAQGTLAARAGNSFDRALLLAALLERMGHTVRFATADLDADVARGLVELSLQPPHTSLPDHSALALTSLDAAAVRSRAERDHALLVGAFDDRIAMMDDAQGLERGAADAAAHAWVQLEEQGTWLDLDPTLPSSEPGDTLTAATATEPTIADAMHQAVVLRVVSETLTGGELVETVHLEHDLDAATAAGTDLYVLFMPAPSGSSVDLFGGVGGSAPFVPVLAVGDELLWGTSFESADIVDESGGLGFGGGGGDIALVGLWIEVETRVPGEEPYVARRPLLDRAAPADRQAGSLAAETLAPMPVGPTGPEPLAWIHHLMVSNGGADPVDHVLESAWAADMVATELADPSDDLTLQAALWPQAVADRSLVLASERVAVPSLDVGGQIHAFVGRPRVYVASLGPDPTARGAIAQRSDLLIDDVTVIARGGEEALSRIWYGALMSALETEHGLLMAQGVDPSAGSRASASLAMGEPLSVLDASALDALPAGAASGIREALEAGWLVVVPADVASARVWWEIGPRGATRAMLAPRLGGWQHFPGTGKASIFHFKPTGQKLTRPPNREAPTKKLRIRPRPGDEWTLLVGSIAIPGEYVVSWGGTALALLFTFALDYLLDTGAFFRRSK